MKTYTCNQCHTKFDKILNLKGRTKINKQGRDTYLVVGCCHNPACPNYGIIQQPVERMR